MPSSSANWRFEASVFCDEQREVVELLPALSAKLERVISPGIALEQLPQEYERLLSGKSRFLKTIVKPGGRALGR